MRVSTCITDVCEKWESMDWECDCSSWDTTKHGRLAGSLSLHIYIYKYKHIQGDYAVIGEDPLTGKLERVN